jgi:hypothetical protein
MMRPGNKCALSQTNAADHIYSTPLERGSATAKGQVVRLTFKPVPGEHVRSGSSSNTDTAHIRHPPLLCCSSYLRTYRPSWPVLRILFFCPSWIPDPKTATKERGEKNLLSYHFFSHKYHKIKKNLFELVKNKIWANLQRIELFTQHIVIKLPKI